MKRQWSWVVLLGGLTFVASGAAAQDAQARARELFDEGSAHVAAGRWESAYTSFEEAYALSGRSLFVFNMAECARFGGRLEDARRDYERYLELAPDGSRAAEARAQLAQLPPAPAIEPDRAPVSDEIAPVNTPPMQLPPPPTRPLEIWEDWPFWTIIGITVAALTGAAIGLGVVLGDEGSQCGGCPTIDWRM